MKTNLVAKNRSNITQDQQRNKFEPESKPIDNHCVCAQHPALRTLDNCEQVR